MLKLDDVVRHGKGSGAAVSPRWQRVTDFLKAERIKANYGLLADSLEGDCPGYVAWLTNLVAGGQIELWHHGYYSKGLPEEMKVNGRTAEYLGGPVSEQAACFNKSLALAKEKLGVEIVAFGPHSTAIDAVTYEAMEGIPQFRLVWFYGPPKGVRTSKGVVQRLMELERPLFVPNPDQLRENFEKKKGSLPYIALQGHPNQWDDARFDAFKRSVFFLRDQGCRFLTASEFLAEETGKKAPLAPAGR